MRGWIPVRCCLQQALDDWSRRDGTGVGERTVERGRGCGRETLRGIASGKVTGGNRMMTEATLAPILEREDGRDRLVADGGRDLQPDERVFTLAGNLYRFRSQTCHLHGVPVSEQEVEGGIKPPLRDEAEVEQNEMRQMVERSGSGACGTGNNFEPGRQGAGSVWTKQPIGARDRQTGRTQTDIGRRICQRSTVTGRGTLWER